MSIENVRKRGGGEGEGGEKQLFVEFLMVKGLSSRAWIINHI